VSRRGVTQVVGLVLLVAIAVVTAGVVGVLVTGFEVGNAPVHASVSATADRDPATGRTTIQLRHGAGDPLVVDQLEVRVFVEGTPLAHQPPIPFFAATGFAGGPTGPFNSNSADRTWNAGETTEFTIARTTNAPQPTPEDHLIVRLFIDGQSVAVAETTVG
jgi:archaeal type IV pilus assembly protein PilA